MSLNTVPTNYHEFEYAKFFLFKLKFMNTGRIHAERWHERAEGERRRQKKEYKKKHTKHSAARRIQKVEARQAIQM